MHRLNNTEGKAKQTTQKELSSSITDIACYRTKVRRVSCTDSQFLLSIITYYNFTKHLQVHCIRKGA